VTHLRKGGARIDVWTSVSVLKDAAGEPIGVVAVNRDVSTLKRAREAVADSERKYRHLVEDMQDVVFAMDATGTVTYISPRAEEFTGWAPDEITGRSFLEFIHPDDCEAETAHFADQMRGVPGDSEFRVIDKFGSVHWVRSSSRAVEHGGQIVGLRGVLDDITDRKRDEEENLRIEKLESLAVLAGGIAHDFNNILTAVTANLSVAAEEAAAGEDVADSIEDARRAAAMAKALTLQLLSFSKGGEPVKETTSIGEIVTASAKFALSGAASKLKLSIADDLWLAEVDPSQIGRMIENLVINADQSMGDGGTVVVKLGNVDPFAAKDDQRPSVLPGRSIKLTVADSGKGIPESDLQRIFDPYFTTKEQGSGLGLASVHTVVNRHGGRISVKSEEGRGTTFTVLLPAVEGRAHESSVPSQQSTVLGERILIMDDDRLVQISARRALTRLGYDVVIAEDGDLALGKYVAARSNGQPFDLVIMDLVIPGGMGGKEAIKRLLEIDPRARAIVSSGYSTDPVMSDYQEHGFKGAVAKPWDLDEIGRTIREVLDGG